MKTSSVGINLIKEVEGLELKGYPDPGTGGKPYTIGYGHTGSDVYLGKIITEKEAEDLLVKDLKKFEDNLNKVVKVSLSQNEYDALICFMYNIGAGAFNSSTLLKKLNNNDREGASNEFKRWNKANGKILNGLVKRREKERLLFIRK